MIVYFSATNNSKTVAEKIAAATNDNAVSMIDVNKKITLRDGEQLGIVTPTYFWRLPIYADEFLNRIKIENAGNSYIFYVATYGTTSGQTDYFVKQHLENKGLLLSASYNIKTVDNWTVWFDVKDKDRIAKILDDEKEQTEKVIESIKDRKNVFINKDKMPLWLCKGAKVFYNQARKTKHLNVNDNCIGCRWCADNCPAKVIEIVDGKPEWIVDKCIMCFKCLHNCPTFAIQYDNKTKKNGQYTRKSYKKTP